MAGIPDNTRADTPNREVIRVAIIEDRREIRDALSMLINGTGGFSCAGIYRTMEDALANIESERPDVVLADIGLPGMSGIEGVRILKERDPN
ncbi:MAG TPA: response regulator, partial [Blastocatellia bacterium]